MCAPMPTEVAKGLSTFGDEPTHGGRKAMRGRRKVGEPRRWLSWGKRVGRGQANPDLIILRRDAEPIQAKSLILCCLEKP